MDEIFLEEWQRIPSYSYGCARTSGVTVYRPKHSTKRAPKPTTVSGKSHQEPVTSRWKNTKKHPEGKSTRKPTASPRSSCNPARNNNKCKRDKPQIKDELEGCFENRGIIRDAVSTGQTKRTASTSSTSNTSDKAVCSRADISRKKKIRGLYPCDICGEIFTFQTNLRRHLKLHDASTDYRCGKCGKNITSKRNLSRHMKLHLPQFRDQAFACDKCDKTFHRIKYLRHHQLVHSSDRAFPCQFCAKAFKTFYNLQSHEASIHAKCREYVCQHCGVAFTRKQYRTIHERIHTKDRPYRCGDCTKSFMRKDRLQTHRKTHQKQNC